MTILLIDNYDSFVFNVARSLVEQGAEVEVVRNDAITLAAIEQRPPAAIVLSPGPKGPAEAGLCLEIIARFADRLPLLGICLGHQALGLAFGGRIGRARRPLHGQATAITHDGQGLFAGLSNPLRVARYHSLIVEGEVGPLVVAARSIEGEIMALRHPTRPVYGVQFHPESILTDQGDQLFDNFLSAVAGR